MKKENLWKPVVNFSLGFNFCLIWIFLLCSVAQAQCVAEVKDVLIDEIRGSIIVETQYKLNGVVVDVKANPDANAIGRTRYTEESGTKAEIVAKAKADIEQHCGNLIIRNAINVNNLNADKLAIAIALTEPMIADLRANAIGYTETMTQKVVNFKNKEITIEADGTYTINPLP